MIRMYISALMFIISVAAALSPLHAQIQMGGMKMQVKADPEAEQFVNDLMNRRVSISPASIAISHKSKTAVFEFSNPTEDTLRMEILISNSVPEKTKRISQEGAVVKKSLIDEETSDSETIYRPLSHWLSGMTKELVLAPGEKKKVEISISIPDSIVAGEYMAWVVAEVAPRKLVKNQGGSTETSVTKKRDGVLITVSSGKLTYTVPVASKALEEKK